jgi:hypothetical protein
MAQAFPIFDSVPARRRRMLALCLNQGRQQREYVSDLGEPDRISRDRRGDGRRQRGRR